MIVINKLAEQKVGLFPIIMERKHKLQLPVEIIKSLTCDLNTNKWQIQYKPRLLLWRNSNFCTRNSGRETQGKRDTRQESEAEL